MFFPIGFGNWPKTIPFCIILITAICIAWSIEFFPTVNETDKKIQELQKTFKPEFIKLTQAVFKDACVEKFGSVPECDYTGDKKDNKDKKKPDLKTLFSEPVLFWAKFRTEPNNWPQEAKNSTHYESLINLYENHLLRSKEIYEEKNFLTLSNLTPFTLLQASFTHAGWLHLIGNLIVLLALGVWVEQRVGFFLTALLFLAGSFAGLYLQLLWSETSTTILGASAGISSFIGAFFVFFYKTEIRFIFTMFPFYFKKISMPALWIYPFFYLTGDILAVGIGQKDGVGHLAHVGGIVVGLIAALCVQLMNPLNQDQLFPQEDNLYQSLKEAKDSKAIWEIFKSIMSWNCQNWRAIKVFFKKCRDGIVTFEDNANLVWLQKQIEPVSEYYFRRGSLDTISEFVKSLPTLIDLKELVKDRPISQILITADKLANKNDYRVASRLYTVALSKNPTQTQKEKVLEAIHKIDQLLAENEVTQ